jgi:propionyl-CoA carboxylase alpha chain
MLDPAPSPEDPRRVALARRVPGAGTVEFLLRADGRFFFLEVNTRLQVEHPVTECVYGVDLVRLQIEIAEGARLPERPPEPDGHAIETRLYAEDPAQGWRPATGRLHTFEIPHVDAEFRVPGGYGVRADSGVAGGSEIGVHYDSMLAKVIAWAPTRAAAARRLAAVLRRSRLHGVTTNRDLLVRILTDEGFLAGDTATDYLDRRRPAEPLTLPLADDAAVRVSALVADAAANRAAAPVLGGLPPGWRNVPSQPQRKIYAGPSGDVEVAYRFTRDGLRADGYPDVRYIRIRRGASATDARDARDADEITLEIGGIQRVFSVRTAGTDAFVDSELGPVTLRAVPRFADPEDLVAAGSLLAPMPGTVVRVLAERGATVTAGEPLVVLEAMKMEHRVAAATSGVLTELNVTAGQQVDSGTILAVIVAPAEA